MSALREQVRARYARAAEAATWREPTRSGGSSQCRVPDRPTACAQPSSRPSGHVRWMHGRVAADGGALSALGTVDCPAPALVAQRIEHLTTDQKVGGSSPSERATTETAGKRSDHSASCSSSSSSGRIGDTGSIVKAVSDGPRLPRDSRATHEDKPSKCDLGQRHDAPSRQDMQRQQRVILVPGLGLQITTRVQPSRSTPTSCQVSARGRSPTATRATLAGSRRRPRLGMLWAGAYSSGEGYPGGGVERQMKCRSAPAASASNAGGPW